MKHKQLKAREADYASGKLDTCEIRNFGKTRDWLHNGFSDKTSPVWNLLGDNRTNFSKLFGSVSFCFHGSHYFHAYLIEITEAERSCKLLILTSLEHGTSYEIVVGGGEPDLDLAIKFLKWLGKKLPNRRS